LGLEEPQLVCEHLSELEQRMLATVLRVTFRGQSWSRNCREWVYFDCLLDRAAIRETIELAPCVKDHEHLGTLESCKGKRIVRQPPLVREMQKP
jgi:hypothetical protein